MLFSPVKIGPVSLSNRVVVSPMCQYSADDGSMNDWHLQHAMQMAMSGAGMFVVEATAVERQGRITHHCAGLYSDQNENAMQKVLNGARSVATNDLKFAIQLSHAGRKGSHHVPWRGGQALTINEDAWITAAPSAVPFKKGSPLPEELNKNGMQKIIQNFVDATKRAVRLGFSAIELHGAHGYLIHEFISPVSNQRGDEYGGSLSSRMKFPLEIFTNVRKVVPSHIALGIRLTGVDWHNNGLSIEDSKKVAKQFEEHGADYLCISSGGIITGLKIPIAPDYQVHLAEAVKDVVSIPVRAVGLITTAKQANDIIVKKKADMVALARAFLANPRWGWDASIALKHPIKVPPQYERAYIAPRKS